MDLEWVLKDKSKIPSSIKVRLYQVVDGEKDTTLDNLKDTGMSLDLNSGNNWSGKFEALQKEDSNGLVYRYVAKEEGEALDEKNPSLMYVIFNGLKFVVDREKYLSVGSNTTIVNKFKEPEIEETQTKPTRSQNPEKPVKPQIPDKAKTPIKSQIPRKEIPVKKFPKKLPRTSDVSMVGVVVANIVSLGAIVMVRKNKR